MVSVDTAWSSGATGIARDAETAARLRPMAKADTASNFMGFSFPLNVPRRGGYGLTQTMWQSGNADSTSNGGANDADASGGDASPNDAGASPNGGGANPCASVPSGLPRA